MMRNMQYNVCVCVGKVISINSTTRFLLFVSELTVPNLFVFFFLSTTFSLPYFMISKNPSDCGEKSYTFYSAFFLVFVQYELLLLVGLTTDNVDALSVSAFDSKLN